VLGHQLVVVSDAHLGAASAGDDEALVAFLERVPQLGDCLLVNGDLFDFWFAYRRVVPRRGFAAAAALAHLARRLPIVMTGGNHDRWGGSFWASDAGIRFAPGELAFELDGARVVALHGDGIADIHRSARLMHRITRHPLTTGAFRLLHPDVGIWLVARMSRHLADSTRDPAVLDRAQARQRAWAADRLAADAAIGTLIMSHTHRACQVEFGDGRRYLNPGAWIDGRCYAVVTGRSAELCRFG
jgi:UDP-2,3-diacylglucosamine hydrolase